MRQMIFVGEHTSYTHAWIASATRVEASVAAYNFFLELGLVDEAKATVEKWMALLDRRLVCSPKFSNT